MTGPFTAEIEEIRGPGTEVDSRLASGLSNPVRFANSGGLVFVDESAQ
jgi:hypothetical protein